MPALSVLLKPELLLELEPKTPRDVLAALSEAVAAKAGIESEALLQAVVEREELSSTGFGDGLAMPHARLAGVKRFHVALARVRQGIEFGAIDGAPVRLFLLVVGPQEQRDEYAKLLGRAAKFLKAEAEGLFDAADLVASASAALTNY